MKTLPKILIAMSISLIILIAGLCVYLSYRANLGHFNLDEQRQISVMIRSADDIEQLRTIANANYETLRAQNDVVEGQNKVLKSAGNLILGLSALSLILLFIFARRAKV